MLKPDEKWTVPFGRLDRPPYNVISYVTKSDSSTTPCVQKNSVTFTQAKTNYRNRTEMSAKKNIQLLPPARPYAFNVQFKDRPPDVPSIFRKAANCIKILIGFTSNVLLTVASLLDMGAGQNLIIKGFLQAWRESTTLIRSL